VSRKIEGTSDPAAWMIDHPSIPRTPKTVHLDGCYICEDDEYARMGLPLCYPCPTCGKHIAADDTMCADGHDADEARGGATPATAEDIIDDLQRLERAGGQRGEEARALLLSSPVRRLSSGLIPPELMGAFRTEWERMITPLSLADEIDIDEAKENRSTVEASRIYYRDWSHALSDDAPARDVSAREATSFGALMLHLRRPEKARHRRVVHGDFTLHAYAHCVWCGLHTSCWRVEHLGHGLTSPDGPVHMHCEPLVHTYVRVSLAGWGGRGDGGAQDHVEREARPAVHFLVQFGRDDEQSRGHDLVTDGSITLGQWRTARRMRSAQQRAADPARRRRFGGAP
jgi:hypothetical protein